MVWWDVAVQQGLDQRPVGRHGLALAFGVDRAFVGGDARGAGVAVVLDDLRVLDGDVFGAAVEVVDRVAAGAHDVDDQRVGAVHGLHRVVDEAALDVDPAVLEAVALLGLQVADVERAVPLLPLGELGLGGAPVAASW